MSLEAIKVAKYRIDPFHNSKHCAFALASRAIKNPAEIEFGRTELRIIVQHDLTDPDERQWIMEYYNTLIKESQNG